MIAKANSIYASNLQKAITKNHVGYLAPMKKGSWTIRPKSKRNSSLRPLKT
jgi:hypothetical protein